MNTVQSTNTGASVKKHDQFEELVSTSEVERNWRGVLIALLVILAVLSLILVSTVLLSPPEREPRVTRPKISVQNLTQGHFHLSPEHAHWISEDEILFMDTSNGVSRFNATSNVVTQLMKNSSFRQLNAVEFKASRDLKYVVLVSGIKKVYTNTRDAVYHIYEVVSQVTYPLRTSEDDWPERLQRVEFSPVGNGLAWVHKRDLYYSPTAERGAQHFRITESGSEKVSNGFPDWIYQEEVQKDDVGFWFSDEGSYLAYAVYNDTLVGQVDILSYKAKTSYPTIKSINYPKPGTPNPTVSLWVVDLGNLGNSTPVQLEPPASVTPSGEPYLTTVQWVSDTRLLSVWVNRRQNLSVFSICDGPEWQCREVYKHKVDIGFVEMKPGVLSKGEILITRLPILDGNHGRFMQVVSISTTTGDMIPLTEGQDSVTDILAWDTLTNILYYEAAPQGKVTQRHLYRVSASTNLTLTQACITCPTHYGNTSSDIALPENNETEPESRPVRTTDCLFTKSIFSPKYPRFYIIHCLGPDVPSVHVMESANHTKIFDLNTRDSLRNNYTSQAVPQIRLITVKINERYKAHVKLQLPPGLREYEDMVFPLILKVSYKPGEQSVTNEWSVDYSSYLASSRNFIVAEVDGRGSANSGIDHLNEARLHLGGVDALDQMAVISQLVKSLKFIDKKRIGIYGQGYGGFLAITLLSQETSEYHCGMSISGIYSWLHYNSVWTERWLATANVTDNYRGYEESDLSRHIGNLENKSLLLVHGTGDMIATQQHPMLLAASLVQANLLFSFVSYTDEGHHLTTVLPHLYKTMDQFWTDCFGPLDFTEWELGTGQFSFKLCCNKS